MDQDRFDGLTRPLGAAASRRGLGHALAGGGLGALFGSALGALTVDAKKKRHKKNKKKKCAKAGQTTSKKRKRCCQGLVQDGTGRCAQPASDCIPATCGPTACGNLPDGCGGTLNCGGCASNSLCDAGVCQPCTVTCVSGIPTVCGADLQAVLEDAGEGATVYACPGRYQGGFILDAAVRVIGAGDGLGSTSNTILDANGAGRVLQINAGAGLVALERLRLTGGAADRGGGVFHEGTTLRMTECTVSSNTVNSGGGGIFVRGVSTLEMTRCTVRGNEAAGGFGGGILANGDAATLTDCLIEDNSAEFGGGISTGGPTTLAGSTQVRGNTATRGGGIDVSVGELVIAETCRVTDNTADSDQGGGIAKLGFGVVSLQGGDPSPIVVNNCHENCAGVVPKCAATPVSCPP